MAQKTREELNAANAALFVNNETGDITPDEERAYNEDVNDSFAIRYEFDVTLTDTAAIQAMNSSPIELVPDDGLLQLNSATIVINNDGTTNYDFGGYLSINSGTGIMPVQGLTADWGVTVPAGVLSINTVIANSPNTYNLTKVSRDDNNRGGLYLTCPDGDATTGNRTVRVYGTYTKFPIA
jgi:hypothetical protein